MPRQQVRLGVTVADGLGPEELRVGLRVGDSGLPEGRVARLALPVPLAVTVAACQ